MGLLFERIHFCTIYICGFDEIVRRDERLLFGIGRMTIGLTFSSLMIGFLLFFFW
jgi:hypothetical protein